MRVKHAVLATTMVLGLAIGAVSPAGAALLPPLPPPPALPALPALPSLPAPLPQPGTPLPNPIPPEIADQAVALCAQIGEVLRQGGTDPMPFNLACGLAVYGGAGFYATLALNAPPFLCFTLAQAGYDQPEIQSVCMELAVAATPYGQQLYTVLAPVIAMLP